MNSSRFFAKSNVSYLNDPAFLSYLVNVGFRSRFQIDNILQKGSSYSFHPESVLISIEIENEGLSLKAESRFFKEKYLTTLLEAYGKAILSNYRTNKHVRISHLENLDLKSISIFSSYLVVPMLITFLFIFLCMCTFFYGSLSIYLEQVLQMKNSNSAYLEYLNLGKNVESFYDTPTSVWKASFLMSIFGSGVGVSLYFLMHFIIYRILPHFSTPFLFLHIILTSLITYWLWPNIGSHWLLYIMPFGLFFSLPLFIMLSRNLPFFIKECCNE